jgi:hypothetical protein
MRHTFVGYRLLYDSFILTISIMTATTTNNNHTRGESQTTTSSVPFMFVSDAPRSSNAPSVMAPTPPTFSSTSLVGLWGNVANYNLNHLTNNNNNNNNNNKPPTYHPDYTFTRNTFPPYTLAPSISGSVCMEMSCTLVIMIIVLFVMVLY